MELELAPESIDIDEILQNVSVEVLGIRFSVEEFRLEAIPENAWKTITKWEIGGITDPMGQLINWLWDQIKNALQWLYNSLTSVINGAIDALKGWFSGVLDGLKNTFQWIIDTLWSNIKGAFDWIWNAIDSALSSLSASLFSLIQSTFDAIRSAINFVGEGLTSLITQIWSGIQSMFDTLTTTISTVFEQIWQGIQSFVDSVMSAVQGVADAIVSSLTEFVESIQMLFNDIWNGIQGLIDTISATLTQIWSGIQSLFEQVFNAITNLGSMLVNAIQGFVNGLMSAIQGIASAIGNVLTQLWQGIQWLGQQIWQGIQNITTTISNVLTQLWQGIQSIFNTIVNTVTSVLQSVWQALTSLGQQIAALFGNIVNAITSAFQSLLGAIQGMVNAITSALQGIVSGIVSAIQQFFTKMMQGFQWLGQQISLFFSNIAKTVSNILTQVDTLITSGIQAITKFFGNLFDRLKGAVDFMASALMGFVNAILKFPEWFPRWFYENIAKPITEALKKIGEWFWQGLTTALDAIKKAMQEFVKGLQWVGQQIWNGLQWLGQVIWQGLQALGAFLFNLLRSSVNALFNLGRAIGEAIYETFIKPLFGALNAATEELFKLFGLHSPAIPYEVILARLLPYYFLYMGSNAAVALGDAVGDTEVEIKVVGTGYKIRMGLAKIAKALQLKDLAISLLHGFITGISFAYFGGSIMKLVEIEALKSARPLPIDVGEAMEAYRRGLIDEQKLDEILAMHGLRAEYTKILADLAFEYPREEVVREAFFRGLIDVNYAKELLRKIGIKPDYVDMVINTWYRLLEPEALKEAYYKQIIGLEEAKNYLAKLGYKPEDIEKLTATWFELPEKSEIRDMLFRGIIDVNAVKSYLRMKGVKEEYIDNVIKVWYKLPSESNVKEMFFRQLVTSEEAKKLLKAHGLLEDYIDKLMETWYKLPSESDIREAFLRGVIRMEDVQKFLKMHGIKDDWMKIATANWWKLFSESDLELLIGRTVRVTPQGEVQIPSDVMNFVRAILRAHGFAEDLVPENMREMYKQLIEAKIYEMAIQPSISDLIEFMVKDVFPHLQQQYGEIVAKIRELGAEPFLKLAKMKGLSEYWALAYWEAHWRLIPPEHLADLYFWGFIPKQSFETYMRYHDFRPIPRVGMPRQIQTPWGETVEGSDIWLQALSLYEIPLRIDVRWMIRWGIKSPYHNVSNVAEELAKIMVERRTRPDWAPAIFVAEWVNNLLDERNRLVTALIKNLDEGFITFDEFEKVVSKYEIKTLPDTIKFRGITGQELTLKVPKTIWLLNPDEIELNKLRVKYDRAYLMKKMQLETIEMEYVAGAISDEELAKALEQIIPDEEVRKRWLIKIKARKIRDQLYYTHRQLLRTVDALCALYEEGVLTREQVINEIRKIAGNILTDEQIEIIVRESDYRIKRSITRYKVRAIISKLRRGAILPEEALQELKKIGIRDDIAQAIVEAEGKVYTLSLGTLLSYIEDVPEAKNLLPKKLKALGVPEDEAKIVEKVAMVRPLKDEIRRLITRILDAYEEGVISDQELQQQLQRLKAFGYTDEEIRILMEVAKWMRMIKEYREQRKEYIPTPTQLASMAEYVPEARKMLKEVLEKRRVPREWAQLWSKYVIVRPVYDEVRRYVTELISDFADGIIDEATLRRELESLKQWGLDDYEIQFLIELAKKRRMRRLARQRR